MRGPRSFSIQLEAEEPLRISSMISQVDADLGGERERLGRHGDVHAAEELVDGLDRGALAGSLADVEHLVAERVEDGPRRLERLLRARPP